MYLTICKKQHHQITWHTIRWQLLLSPVLLSSYVMYPSSLVRCSSPLGFVGLVLSSSFHDSSQLLLLSQAAIEQLVALGESALDEQGISWTDATYIGIACPGQIDRRVPGE